MIEVHKVEIIQHDNGLLKVRHYIREGECANGDTAWLFDHERTISTGKFAAELIAKELSK